MTVLSQDAVVHLRKRREIHLGQQELTAHYMAALLLEDAMVLGVNDVRVRTFSDDWTVLSAGQDWTRLGPGSDLSRAEVFRRLIPLDAAGVNAVRHEVYLTAYCRDAFVRDANGIEAVAGAPPAPEWVATLEPTQFHVGFRV